jgi:asparaginyl-tRNA synthetase
MRTNLVRRGVPRAQPARARVHRFSSRAAFVYVHTPIITASDCEGAGEMFRVTTLDPRHRRSATGDVNHGEDFFGKPTT